MAITVTNATASAMCDAAVDLLDTNAPGEMTITTSGGGTILSEHALAAPNAFGDASNGVATANTIAADTSANNTGTAAECHWYDGNALEIFEGTVTATAGGGDIELNSVSIQSGVQVTITAGGTITMPTS